MIWCILCTSVLLGLKSVTFASMMITEGVQTPSETPLHRNSLCPGNRRVIVYSKAPNTFHAHISEILGDDKNVFMDSVVLSSSPSGSRLPDESLIANLVPDRHMLGNFISEKVSFSFDSFSTFIFSSGYASFMTLIEKATLS